MEYRDAFFYKLWFLVIVVLIASNLLLVSFNLSTTEAIGINPVAAKTTVRSVTRVGVAIQDYAVSVSRSTTSSIDLIVHLPIHFFNTTSRFDSFGTLIRPEDRTPAPVISPLYDEIPTVHTASQAANASNDTAQWPIHGAITTPFGVPELPYERIHTGLDISDGKALGVSPVKPFMPGKVAAVILSQTGLGNHVVIDHEGGVTSIYGHLNSIAVASGQVVSGSTVLGYEGSTGASTGTHLHFEIRLNGRPVDPHQYIAGHP